MSQDEILKYMRKKGGPVTVTELCQKLNQGRSSVSVNIKKLKENREVKSIFVKMSERGPKSAVYTLA